MKSPNPAWDGPMPLVRSFALSTKKGKETWVQSIVDREHRRIRFEIRTGPGCPEGTISRNGAVCFATGTPVPLSYIRAEGKAGRMDSQLMAIVAEGPRGRIYLPPNEEHEGYGMTKHRHLFTDRQLVALSAISTLVGEARVRVRSDAVSAGLADDGVRLAAGGAGVDGYADALVTYLAFTVDRLANEQSQLCTWDSNATKQHIRATFSRQALPMSWDFAEGNFFGSSTGNIEDSVRRVSQVVEVLPAITRGVTYQSDATVPAKVSAVYSTDPPYYDNVGYADLSDFFYVWLRKMVGATYPVECSTLLVPKSQELVADPHRYEDRADAAEQAFEAGIGAAFQAMRRTHIPGFPLSIIYAFRQSEDTGTPGHHASTGWETMLEGLLRAGISVHGTWPIRSERTGRVRDIKSNALASSIVLACRLRSPEAQLATRKEFLGTMKAELPSALRHLQQGNIAPVDLAQAAIGPGMGVFSRYTKVLEADGSAMTVRTALGLINQVLDETLAEQEADFDPETRWALAWFEQHGMNPGPFGVAETLSKAKNTAVNGLVAAGIAASRAGKVQLLDRDELPLDWNPATDRRLTVWEITQHLIRALDTGGEAKAADLLYRVGGGLGETARELAYRLYTFCERKNWPREALAYNALVIAWPEILRLAAEEPAGAARQQTLV